MASKQGTIAMTVDPVELKNLFKALSLLPKDSQDEIRTQAQAMSKKLAGEIMVSGLTSPTPQARLVVESIVTPRDRLVRVDIGGSKKVGRKYGGTPTKSGKLVKQNAAPAGALLWGSEFGSEGGVDSIGRKYTRRFKLGRNKRGYWINPAVDANIADIAAKYSQLIQDTIDKLKLGSEVK
jgi:hypothetical protein